MVDGTTCARVRTWRTVAGLSVAALLAVGAPVGAAPLSSRGGEGTGTLPPGFVDEAVLSGLDFPTAVAFAADGRVYVAEKRGVVKVFDGLFDPTAQVFADLRTQVHDYWDRGLQDIAVHPDFPVDPRVYVLYSHNAPIGGTAPAWTDPDTGADDCPTPPGPLADGCVISGRLSVLRAPAVGGHAREEVLVEDWCQQYPAHSVAGLGFGPDGALYASGGDGAGFTFVDYGSVGDHPNPCGDPPNPAGTWLFPPDSQGGALRAQDVGLPGDPTGLSGALIRVDPTTGEGLPDNPFAASPDPGARRIVAYGLRNPYRFAFRPGTSEVWLADVGYNDHEELNRVLDPTDATAENFGWPCYEGPQRQPGYEAAGLDACRDLYEREPISTVAPWLSYAHGTEVTPGEDCEPGSSSVTGLAFYPAGGRFPARYDGALFFADYARHCIWVVPASDGTPDPTAVELFSSQPLWPMDLQVGPDQALYYVEPWSGEIRRISYVGDAPASCPAGELRAAYHATPDDPPAVVRCEALPLARDWGRDAPADGLPVDGSTVRWEGAVELAGGPTTFAVTADDEVRLRLDGEVLVDVSGAGPSRTHRVVRDLAPGRHTLRLEYRDVSGPAAVALGWTDDNAAPVPVITTPVAGTRWAVGDRLAFSGGATDPEDGALPAAALTWALELEHCPQACHTHPLVSRAGVAAGTVVAPDHEHPSHLVLRLTATDRHGRRGTTTRRLDPRTVDVRVTSHPPGLSVAVGGTVATTPFTETVIAGSTVWASAPSPQDWGGRTYRATGWLGGGGTTRLLNPTTDVALRAVFAADAPTAAGTGQPRPAPHRDLDEVPVAPAPRSVLSRGEASGGR